MIFNALDPKEIQKPLFQIFQEQKTSKAKINKYSQENKLILMEQDDFTLFNPNTLTCPVFLSEIDYLLTKKIYKNGKIILEKKNPVFPNLEIHRMFNISDDFKNFYTKENIKNFKRQTYAYILEDKNKILLPVYEAKFIYNYDHRYRSFKGSSDEDIKNSHPKYIKNEEKQLINYCVKTRYWIDNTLFEEKKKKWNWNYNWFLVIRLVVRSTDKRTSIATIIPNYPSVNSLNIILGIKPKEAVYILSVLNSFVFDYIIRQKMSGANLNQFILEQIPLPNYKLWARFEKIIMRKCIELICTNKELDAFAKDCGCYGIQSKWDDKQRKENQAEIDAITAILFDLTKSELDYILEKFPIIKENDIAEFGYYYTKEIVQKYYDYHMKNKEEVI